VRVDVKLRWFRLLASISADRSAAKSTRRTAVWRCGWSDLDRVLVGGSSMIFYPIQGRGCGFVGMSQRLTKPVLGMLEARNVRVEFVRSMWWRRATI
jgi:hypothetical protein